MSGEPLRIGLTWDSLPAPPEGVDARARVAFQQIDLNGQLESIKAVTGRKSDYEQRYQAWWSNNANLLTREQRVEAQNTFKKNVAELDAERDSKFARISSDIVGLANTSAAFTKSLQGVFSNVLPFGKKSEPVANPFADPKAREELDNKIRSIYLAKVTMETSLATAAGRPVSISFWPAAADLAAAAKKKGTGGVDLALLTGNGAAWSGADKALKPLLVGGRNAHEVRNGIEMNLILNRDNPALKSLHAFESVMAGKAKDPSERNWDAAKVREREDESARALLGNRDIKGFERLPGAHADLEKQRDQEIQRIYDETNSKWKKAAGRPAEQQSLQEQFAVEQEKIRKYYQDLIDRAVLSLSDAGMKKLLGQLACQPLALDTENAQHRFFGVQQLLQHAGQNAEKFFTARNPDEKTTAYEEVAGANGTHVVAVGDTSQLRFEQRNRYGMYKYGFVVVKNADFAPTVPASALWYDPQVLDPAIAASIQKEFTTGAQKGARDVAHSFVGRITGARHWEVPTEAYPGQLAAFRDKFPTATAVPALRANKPEDCPAKAQQPAPDKPNAPTPNH